MIRDQDVRNTRRERGEIIRMRRNIWIGGVGQNLQVRIKYARTNAKWLAEKTVKLLELTRADCYGV